MKDKTNLEILSNIIGVNPNWIDKLITAESNWNPSAKNPNSSARGLIQFTDATAQSLGYKDSLDLINKNPTVEDQLLNPVLKYLSRYAPFNNKQQFYLSVFYPAAINWSEDREFPKSVQEANKKAGIRTVRDYINFVEKTATTKRIIPIAIGIIAIGAIIYVSAKATKTR